jgi:hypothetical protein
MASVECSVARRGMGGERQDLLRHSTCVHLCDL